MRDRGVIVGPNVNVRNPTMANVILANAFFLFHWQKHGTCVRSAAPSSIFSTNASVSSWLAAAPGPQLCQVLLCLTSCTGHNFFDTEEVSSQCTRFIAACACAHIHLCFGTTRTRTHQNPAGCLEFPSRGTFILRDFTHCHRSRFIANGKLTRYACIQPRHICSRDPTRRSMHANARLFQKARTSSSSRSRGKHTHTRTHAGGKGNHSPGTRKPMVAIFLPW